MGRLGPIALGLLAARALVLLLVIGSFLFSCSAHPLISFVHLPRVDPGVGPTKETAFSDILLLFCAISATEGEQ